MRLSEKKKQELYNVIHEQIMQHRLVIANSEDVLGKKNANDIDEMLFRLNQNIWKHVKITLGVANDLSNVM